MSRKILVHPVTPSPSPSPSPSLNRWQPLLPHSQSSISTASSSSSSSSGHIGEVAGGTTAECAAVCCCCPCSLVNLLILTVYKVPAGLCRRAMRKKRHNQMIKKGLMIPQPRVRRRKSRSEYEAETLQVAEIVSDSVAADEEEKEEEMVKLEKEMWERFCNSGFWRSLSQRETPTILSKVTKQL